MFRNVQTILGAAAEGSNEPTLVVAATLQPTSPNPLFLLQTFYHLMRCCFFLSFYTDLFQDPAKTRLIGDTWSNLHLPGLERPMPCFRNILLDVIRYK